jgi:hypothetical protein
VPAELLATRDTVEIVVSNATSSTPRARWGRCTHA